MSSVGIGLITPDFSSLIGSNKEIGAPVKEMLSVRKDGAQTIVKINSSSLSLIQTCPRKSFYSLHERWKSRTGSPPLVYGSAIHKAMEVFYSHTSKEREIPVNFEESAEAMAHGDSAPERHFLYDAISGFIAAAEPLRNLPDTDKRSIPSGVWVLSHYFKTYINDTYVIHSDDNGPIVERSFSIPYYEDKNLKIELFGQIDFALRNELTGEVLPGDHKTSSQLGSEFFNRIKPNHQYTGYLIGAKETLGLDGEHFLVNGIQVKAIPKTALGGPPSFTRQITRRNEQDFAEFKDALIAAVRNYLRWSETGVWPIGVVDACANYGGCQYLDICSQPNELKQNILESKFYKEI